MGKKLTHSLYVVLPYTILSNPKLSSTAKLILGEIISLLRVERNFIFASNNHFASLFGCKPLTISLHINNLVKEGYIKTEVFPHGCQFDNCPIKTKNNHRHIYPLPPLFKILDTLSSFLIEGYQVKHKQDIQLLDIQNSNNIIVSKNNKSQKSKNWIKELLMWYEETFKTKIASYGKQIGSLGRMKKAGYTPKQIKEALLKMWQDKFWADKKPDFSNLVGHIHKFFVRDYKRDYEIGRYKRFVKSGD